MSYGQLLRQAREAYQGNPKAKIERSERNLFALYLIRPVSLLITPLFLMMRLRANHVTWIGFSLAVVSAGLYANGDWTFQLVAVCIYFTHVLLDYVDGNLARFQRETSHYGKFLDGSLEVISLAILYPAIGWGVLRECAADPVSLFCSPALPFQFLLGTIASLAFIATGYMTLRYQHARTEARSDHLDGQDPIVIRRSPQPDRSEVRFILRLVRLEELLLRSIELPLLILTTAMGWLTVFIGVFALHHLAMFVWSYANALLMGRRDLQGTRPF